MIFTLEVAAIVGTDKQIKVEVATKKADETGDGGVVSGVNITRTTSGVESATIISTDTPSPYGLYDFVRYKFTASGNGFVLFRMLSPVWYDALLA